MFKKLTIFILFIIFSFYLFGEEQNNNSTSFYTDTQTNSQNVNNHVLLANSSKDYPVTPGDVYKLTYINSIGINSFEIIVQSDFSCNLYLFGTLSVENMTFNSFRIMVQQIILNAYPDSSPQLILQSTGVFNIYIKGEVNEASFITCWGLSRLSEVIQEKITNFSSIREISIISSDGTANGYDLFAAKRFGEREQDPYLKPDDTIIIKKYDRQIIVSGEVFRTGIYQLIDGENLNELITIYADGFTELSDTTKIQIKRYNSEKTDAGEMFYLDSSSAIFKDFILQNNDEIYIPNKNEDLPVVFFEGAIESGDEENYYTEEMSSKRIYYFVQGEKLSTAVL